VVDIITFRVVFVPILYLVIATERSDEGSRDLSHEFEITTTLSSRQSIGARDLLQLYRELLTY